MEQNTLKLDVGDRLQLETVGGNHAQRYQIRVIGFLPGKSLLVTTPGIDGKLILVREGQCFNVRMIHGNTVQGFVASVLHSYALPYPHLHLSYPRDVKSIMVRNAARASTNITCAVGGIKGEQKTPQTERSAVIGDLSNSGARLLSSAPLGRGGEMLSLEFRLNTCGAEDQVRLIAVIRSQSGRPGDERLSWQTGVEFKALNRFQKLLLHSYVLEQLVSDQMLPGGGHP